MIDTNTLVHPVIFSPSLSSACPSKPSKLLLMKHYLKLLTMGSLLVSHFAYAEQQNTTGFHGSISLFLGVEGTNSVMDTESQAKITDYSGSEEHHNEAMVIPFWDLNYRFDDASEVYFKSDIIGMANDFYSQTGYRHYLSDGSSITIGVVSGLLEKEVWKNPYQLQAKREITNAAVQGLVLNYDRILGSDWSIELAGGKYSIDQEDSISALDRNANLSYGELSYETDLSPSLGLSWSINYLDVDATGSAEKNQGVATYAELQLRNGRHITMLGASVGLQEFDAINPIWGRTREETKFGVSATYIYAAPFNWKDALFIARGGWDITDANIDFYDHDEYLFTLGMQYGF